MRFTSVKLVNYIGIYNGLGLNEIFIDFTKCKNRLTIIKGDNGSGKSTLFNALTPLPDSNDCFIPGLRAVKEIGILDNNILYHIKFVHGVKENGDRETSKGYIYKILGNDKIDLNPNGNISSFKDIIYNEFKLDANFIALSQLSTEDRGLATKRPAERKKFVNSIIEKLEVYNNIHKTLTKRSSVFKSMINSITSKLDSLGDPNKLKSMLLSLDNRIARLQQERDRCIEDIAGYKSTISMIDPDGSIQMRYNQCVEVMNQVKYSLNSKELELSAYRNSLNIDESIDIQKLSEEINSLKIKTQIDIQSQESKVESMLLERENEAKNLNSKIHRLNSLKSEINYDDLVKQIEIYKEKIKYCEKIFAEIGFEDNIKLSKDEYIIGLNTLKEIKDVVDSYKSAVEYETLREAIYWVYEDKYPDMELYNSIIEDIKLEIASLEKEYSEYELLKQISTKLSMRPKACKIDECGFIKDAISAFEQKPDEQLININEMLKVKRNDLKKAEDDKKWYTEVIQSINDVKTILRNIRSHKSILDKLPEGKTYYSEGYLLKRIQYNESIDHIDDLYAYINYANLFDEYSLYKDTLNKLESEYKVFASKNNIIEEITNDIDSMNKKLDDITKDIENTKNSLLSSKELLLDLSNKQVNLETIISLEKEITTLREKEKVVKEDVNKYQSDIDKINNASNNIALVNRNYESIVNELNPVIEDKDKVKHAISLYGEYIAEIDEYKAVYDKIETIKYYSSPTTGIGLVFMELYMGKILSIANELLSLLFESRYTLMPFVITENEFRIPCSSDGLINDDVSSMSNSQICMISMILSYSLLFNSSTKYNILKADEIDAPLDNTNRAQFANLLENMMNMLDTEQAILISHNSELNTQGADLIVLKSNNIDDISGNIIYKY